MLPTEIEQAILDDDIVKIMCTWGNSKQRKFTMNEVIMFALFKGKHKIVEDLVKVFDDVEICGSKWYELMKTNPNSFIFAIETFKNMKQDAAIVYLIAISYNNIKALKVIIEKYPNDVKNVIFNKSGKNMNHHTFKLLLDNDLITPHMEELIFREALKSEDKDLLKLYKMYKLPTLYKVYNEIQKTKSIIDNLLD